MNLEFETARPYLAHPDQLCYVRLSRPEEGSGRRQRIVDVCSGSGLKFPAFCAKASFQLQSFIGTFYSHRLWRQPDLHRRPRNQSWRSGRVYRNTSSLQLRLSAHQSRLGI